MLLGRRSSRFELQKNHFEVNRMRGVARLTHFWPVACLCAFSALPAVGQTVQLINLVRPTASDFYVGENWVLNVFGAANQAVTISATHNGVPLGTSPLGTTDGSGFLSVSGSMSTAEIGSWVETVFVGGIAATPTLVFDVLGSPIEPCFPASVSPNPLAIFSVDYYTFNTYSHSDFGSGDQSGEGEPPNCAMGGVTWFVPVGSEHLQVTNISFPSLWEAEVEWEDVGGRLFGSHPAFVSGQTTYVGVDLRNGIPFVGIGGTQLTVFRVDF